MPPIKFLVAVSSLTVALTYLFIRKFRINQRVLAAKREESVPDPPSTCTIKSSHSLSQEENSVYLLESSTPEISPNRNPPITEAEDTAKDSLDGDQSASVKTITVVSDPDMHQKSRYNSFGSDNVSPKAVTPETGSSCSYMPDSIPSGYFNDPENDIVEDSPEMYCGKAIPRVLIPNDIWQQISDEHVWTDVFCIPARMGGVLIGRFGKNVRELRSQWKAEFTLNMSPDNQDLLLFRIACPIEYKSEVLNWVSQRFKMRPSRTTIGNPSQLKRYLPLGQATPVHVRSSYGLKEMFVTVPDEKFLKFLEMQREMDLDYSNYSKQRMQLCEPVTSGTVSVLPHAQGFARALIMKVFHVWPIKYALYFLLDHGVFGLIQLNELRKIRAKYMRLPFQAIHVSWAHALPLFSDMPELHLLRSFFSSGQIHATAVRMETCCRASVVFTDLMFVSPPSQRLMQSAPIVPSQMPDFEAYPPLGNHLPAAAPELKMVDVLAMCCRAGLYMVSPLVIYPSRQCWLNQSEIPYFTFTGGEIDYQSYVNYVLEDGTINCSHSHNGDQRKKQSKGSRRQKPRRGKNTKKPARPSKSESADEKENNLVRVTTLAHRDNNNNASHVPLRAADNPWGLKPNPNRHTEPSPEPEKENALVHETAPIEPVQQQEEKPSVRLTMAQIAAMAPPPTRTRPPAPVTKAIKAQPPKLGKTVVTKEPANAKAGSEPQRRPLRSRNGPITKRRPVTNGAGNGN